MQEEGASPVLVKFEASVDLSCKHLAKTVPTYVLSHPTLFSSSQSTEQQPLGTANHSPLELLQPVHHLRACTDMQIRGPFNHIISWGTVTHVYL